MCTIEYSDINDLISNSDCRDYLIERQILTGDYKSQNLGQIFSQAQLDPTKKQFLINALRMVEKYSLASFLDDSRQINTKPKGRKTGEISIRVTFNTDIGPISTNSSYPDVQSNYSQTIVSHKSIPPSLNSNSPKSKHQSKKKSFWKKFLTVFCFVPFKRRRRKRKKSPQYPNNDNQVQTAEISIRNRSISFLSNGVVKRRNSLAVIDTFPSLSTLRKSRSLNNLDCSFEKGGLEDLKGVVFDRVVQFLEEELSCLLFDVVVEMGECLRLVLICTKLQYLDKLWVFYVSNDLDEAIGKCLEGVVDGRGCVVTVDIKEYEEARRELM